MPPPAVAKNAFTSLVLTPVRSGRLIPVLNRPLRLAVVLVYGLLVAACGGGGSLIPDGALPPFAPGSFTAELTPNNEALLRWTAPAPAADRAPVTGYAVYRELSGGGNRKLGETDSLSYVHRELLSPGVRYVFHVRALSVVGQSRASASAFVDVPPSLLPPEPPGPLTAELTPNNEALLTWEAVTGYELPPLLPIGLPSRDTRSTSNRLAGLH